MGCFLKGGGSGSLWGFIVRRFQSKSFSDDGDKNVNRDRDPDLGLYGILAGAVESLYAQMLLNPFEEQFNLPTRLIDPRNRQGGQNEVVRKKLQPLIGFLINKGDTP